MKERRINRVRPILPTLLASVLVLAGCSGSAISPQVASPEIPDRWQTQMEPDPIKPGWLEQQEDEGLLQLVNEALQNNYDLARQAAEVEAARQQVIISGAPIYPALDLSLNGSRNRTVMAGESQHNSDIRLDLELSWELDLWGRLNDSRRQALLSLKARQFSFEQARLQLAADVSGAWYELLAAGQLIALFEERLANLGSNLEIIEFGYRQGITEALDVYLARNEVEQERARLEQQRQTQLEAVNRLQFLLGRYPNGALETDQKLPVFTEAITAGLPSEILKRRPSVQAAWFDLMAADAQLAVAHKARFPALRMTGTLGDSSNALNDLLDGGPLAWSLLGGLTQPLFAGGRLAAREKQAKAELEQSEQRYLERLFTAFTEVENALSKQQTLSQRYQSFLKAQDNALAAQRLAFDQYQRGLISYTSVLESQRRAFDAQTTVLELRNQLLQNRIALSVALGGSITAEAQ